MRLEFGKRAEAVAESWRIKRFEKRVRRARLNLNVVNGGCFTERDIVRKWGADAVDEAKRRMVK